MDSLVDRDIEHIRAATLQSLDAAHANPFLTSSYWRRRIGALMRLHHLSKAQLVQVDAILAIIDQFDLALMFLPPELESSFSRCNPALLRCALPPYL
jgi:hypothetical protein